MDSIYDKYSYLFDSPVLIGSADFVNGFKQKNTKPEIEQIIYSPPATIIKWADGDKTVVKTSANDEYDPVFGVLMAYFQKHSGKTKTQVGKFCDSIIEEFGKQQEKKNKKTNKPIECIDEPCINNKHICCFSCNEYKDCSDPCEYSSCKHYKK